VKEAVFPFNMFEDVDPVLGPEMKATGEVMGIANTYPLAFFKAQEAAGIGLPLSGKVLVTVNDKDKPYIVESAKKLIDLGFEIIATKCTHKFLKSKGINSDVIHKLNKGRPNIVDAIKNREIQLIINTPIGKQGKVDDSYIRSGAIKYKIPYITTTTATKASVDGIEAAIKTDYQIKSIQDYHQMLEEK